MIEAAKEIGVRIVLARSMYDWSGAPKRYLESPEEAVRHTRELADVVAGDTRAFVQPAPHSIHAASPGRRCWRSKPPRSIRLGWPVRP